jgi:hypothetical protein
VAVETFRPVDLHAAASDLPLVQDTTPLTYVSLSDFMNVVTQLRTVPELLRYLDARRKLPEKPGQLERVIKSLRKVRDLMLIGIRRDMGFEG